MSAKDPESDAIAYVIASDPSNKFVIDTTGMVRSKPGAVFDYEHTTQYSLQMKATESGTDDLYEISTTFTVNVIDVNDMSVAHLDPESFSTEGGETITFNGNDFGPLDADEAANTKVAAYYVGPDGVKYYAKECKIVEVNTVIQCTSVKGVGTSHVWNITVSAPGTSEWTVESSETTSYHPPTVMSVHNATNMPTAGGMSVTVFGSNFGPIFNDCTIKCEDEVTKACGDKCIDIGQPCEESSKGKACDEFPDWYTRSVAKVTYGPTEKEVGKYECAEAKVIYNADSAEEMITCKSAEGAGKGFHWKVSIGVRGSVDPHGPLSDIHAQTSNIYYYPESSYQPPSISQIVAGDLPTR